MLSIDVPFKPWMSLGPEKGIEPFFIQPWSGFGVLVMTELQLSVRRFPKQDVTELIEAHA